jgi:hypothetical protein
MNKQLLILFGEWRNFDDIIPQLKFDGFDVIISTWDRKWIGGGAYKVENNFSIENTLTEDYIIKKLPNIKKLLIHDFKIHGRHSHNTENMVFHWRTAIKNVDHLNRYNKILFQRFDCLSNLEVLSEYKIESDTVYIDYPYQDTTLISDHLFILNPSMVNKFLNRWPDRETNFKSWVESYTNNSEDCHRIWYEVLKGIKCNNITIELPKFLYTLIRIPGPFKHDNYTKKYKLEQLNKKGKRFFDELNNFIEYFYMVNSEWNRPFFELKEEGRFIQDKKQITEYFKEKNEKTNI